MFDVHESNGVIYTGGDNGVRAFELNGITYVPADGGTDTPQLYYNGEWLPSQNEGTTSTGGSY
jgi:hypothetical protein